MPDRETLCPAANWALQDKVTVLGVHLDVWYARDDTQPQPNIRAAAGHAIDSIDAVLRQLHDMRSALIDQIRASDEATMARTRALLAERKELAGGRRDHPR